MLSCLSTVFGLPLGQNLCIYKESVCERSVQVYFAVCICMCVVFVSISEMDCGVPYRAK